MKTKGIPQPPTGSVMNTVKPRRFTAHQSHAQSLGVWKELDRNLLLCQAMWELVKEKTALTDNSLFEKIQQMGLLESYQNGKIKEYPIKCSQCNRHSRHDRHNCIYCGAGIARPNKGVFLDIMSVNN